MKNRLVCIPYAGASAAMYNPFRAELPCIEVYPLDIAGKGGRVAEKNHDTFKEAAADCAGAILDIGGYETISLFGYSMGGLLVYEAAMLIFQRFGALPRNIFIAACNPPRMSGQREAYSKYSDAALIEYLLGMGGIDDELLNYPDFKEFFLPIIRYDFALLESYRHNDNVVQLPIKLNILYSDDEESVFEWDAYSSCSCSYHHFDGGHFFINNSCKCVCELIKNVIFT
ncbi:MAG: hypothetical protein LBL49_03600 [Clostridiales Family XIII bacterium]|jgi:surfactin synthase thioesterase subunit|nr:hypothetical protein [Clostridiales Family XIII bacterium]